MATSPRFSSRLTTVAGVFAALCVGLYVVAAGLSILVLGGVPGVSR